MLASAGVLAILVGEVRDGLLVLFGLLPDRRRRRRHRVPRRARARGAAGGLGARRRASGATAERIVRAGRGARARRRRPAPGRRRRSRGRAHHRSSDRLLLDRSVLTGESLPEDGRARARRPTTPPRRAGARSPTRARAWSAAAAKASSWPSGREPSSAGSRAAWRHESAAESPLQRELDRLVRILLVVAIGLDRLHRRHRASCAGNPLGENILAGISAAIAAIPEEPPVLLAVILGLGAYRLLQPRRPRPPAERRGDARRGRPDRHRQDRHAHPEPARRLVGPDARRRGRGPGAASRPPRGGAPGRGGRLAGRRTSRPGRSRARCAARSPSRWRDRARSGRPRRRDRRRPTLCPSPGRARAASGRIEDLALGAPGGRPRLVDAATAIAVEPRNGGRDLIEASAAPASGWSRSARQDDDGPWQHARPRRLRRSDPARHRRRDGDGAARRHPGRRSSPATTRGRRRRSPARQGWPPIGVVTGEELAAWDDDRLARELGDFTSSPDRRPSRSCASCAPPRPTAGSSPSPATA